VKIVCISDTHGEHEQVSLPFGDVLVHAGDITAHGTRNDFLNFIEWFASHPHQHKVFIGGNHDTYLEKEPDEIASVAASHGVSYLNDSGIEIDGVQFWGSPITPRFFDWSFMRDEEDIHHHWALIPENTNVLITHGPVWGVLDEVERAPKVTESTGCKMLAQRVKEVSPSFHIFGHIHECYGSRLIDKTQHVNVSTMNNGYQIQNAPVIVEL